MNLSAACLWDCQNRLYFLSRQRKRASATLVYSRHIGVVQAAAAKDEYCVLRGGSGEPRARIEERAWAPTRAMFRIQAERPRRRTSLVLSSPIRRSRRFRAASPARATVPCAFLLLRVACGAGTRSGQKGSRARSSSERLTSSVVPASNSDWSGKIRTRRYIGALPYSA